MPLLKEKEITNCLLCQSGQALPVRGNDVVQCQACGLVYLRERPSLAWMENYYSHVYAVNEPGAAPPVRKPPSKEAIETDAFIQARRESFLEEALSFFQGKLAGATLVDIGCGWGGLLYTAAKRDIRGIGFEFNVPNVSFGRDVLGLDVRREHFEFAAIEAESLDMVTMVHSLEHLPDPLIVLKKIFDRLKPGGVLAGIVPNFESYLSQTLKEQWQWLERDWHYAHFTIQTAKKILRETGFQICNMYTATGDYGEGEIIRVLKKQFPEKDLNEHVWFLQALEHEARGEEIRFFVRKGL